MNSIITTIKQSIDLKKHNKFPYLYATILMGVFTFLFLGIEYLYVDVLSNIVSESKTVLAQNYALGVSAIGFLLYSLFRWFCKGRLRTVCFIFIGLASVSGITVICTSAVFITIFVAGLMLFLLLGLLGGGVFYVAMLMMKTDRYLARIVGISYAMGILLQFVNNNLVRLEIVEAVILAVFLLLLVGMMIKSEQIYCKQEEQSAYAPADDEQKGCCWKIEKGTIVGILLILLVTLMTCIFSTLDNAVTLVHSSGSVDIGQMPRILLALSGLAAGFIFDIKNRKYMGIIMYCVMVLSTLCIAVLKFAGSFLVGLVIFYLSASFFAVFFTSGFMEISRYMRVPALWAGMGRAVNNMIAALIAKFVLKLLSYDNSLAAIILVLVLFVSVSVVAVVYTFQKKNFMEQIVVDAVDVIDEKEKLRNFSEEFSFTERETEVFDFLINTEDSIQTIADNLYVSRRTLERCISKIYEKTGVKSRVGLLNLYKK